MREIDHIIVHCSATAADDDITSSDIDKWHRARGWFGNGYHFVITRDGRVESEITGHRCRPLKKAGAHVGDCGRGWNARSIAVCLVGGVNNEGEAEDNFTEDQMQSLEIVLKMLQRVVADCKIMGHRDLIKQTNASPKACPSFDVSKFLKDRDI